MTKPEHNTSILIGFLAIIRLKNNRGELRYQNFDPFEIFTWNNKLFTFSSFEVPDVPESTDGDSSSLTAVLPNIDPVRGYVLDGLLNQANLDLIMVIRNGDEEFTKKWGLLIASTAIAVDEEGNNNRIELTLEKRENAITGKIPNIYYWTGTGNGRVTGNITGLVPAFPRSTIVNLN